MIPPKYIVISNKQYDLEMADPAEALWYSPHVVVIYSADQGWYISGETLAECWWVAQDLASYLNDPT